jgi:hypothetical protein
LFFLNLVGDEIDGSASTIHNQDGVVDLEVEKPSLRAEHRGGFGFGDEGETVVVLVAEEASLDGGGARGGFGSVVPNGGHGEVVAYVALFAVKDLAERLLELVAHGGAKVEEVVGGDIDLGFTRWQRWEVDGVDVRVSGEHEL